MSVRRALLLAESLRLPYRVLRCAARCFDEVYVLGRPEAGRLSSSRCCRGFFHAPMPFVAGSETADLINGVCRRLGIDHVLPSCVATVRYLCRDRGALEARCFPVPSIETLDRLDDKGRFAELCASLGVPCPETRRVADAGELHRLRRAGALRFPLVLKPVDLWGSVGVVRLDRDEDVPHRLEHGPVVLQDFIPGEDLCAFYACHAGRVATAVQYRRSGSRFVFEGDARVDAGARRIIAHTRFDGLLGFDARRTAAGEIAFIECNPRFWYRIHLALIAGVNFVDAGFRAAERGEDRGLSPGISVLGQRDILLHLLTPWRLNRHDRALLRHLAADPAPILWGAVERAFTPGFAAAGAQL